MFWSTSEGRLELLWPIGSRLDLDNLLQMVFRISAALTRARELIWGPFFGIFSEKLEQLLNSCNFALEKLEVQSLDFLCNNFLIAVWGVVR